jgi:hypothetical protein
MTLRIGQTLPAIDVDEIDVQTFAFGRAMVAGETITEVAITCDAWSGTDPAPDAVRVGAPVPSGTDVLQVIRGRVDGVTYRLRGRALLSSGRALVAVGYLPCKRL